MVDGLDKFKRRWAAVPERIRAAAMKAMEDAANEIVAEMKRMAPKDTGALADSIGWTWGDVPSGAMVIGTVGARARKKGAQGTQYAAMQITIFAGGATTVRRQRQSSGSRSSDKYRSGYFDSNNAKYQEFGTSKMAANPFFFPAWRAMRRQVKSKIAAAVRKEIKASGQ